MKIADKNVNVQDSWMNLTEFYAFQLICFKSALHFDVNDVDGKIKIGGGTMYIYTYILEKSWKSKQNERSS